MPDEQQVTVAGVTLAVRSWRAEQEASPAAVLVPGTGETADDWDVVAAALARRRTVHAVNLRGHGASDWPGTYSIQSMADDLCGLLPQLSSRPVDLVGHSLGGLVACMVAASRPEAVHRLVLEDVALLRPRTPTPPVRPHGVLPFDWRMVEQVRPEVDNPDLGWSDTVGRIAAPTLVVAGGHRSFVPQEQVADLVRSVSDARLVTLDTGHDVHATAPGAFLEAVLGFLG